MSWFSFLKRQLRDLRADEIQFLRALFRGPSPWLRAIRAQIEYNFAAHVVVDKQKECLEYWFDIPEWYWLPFGGRIEFGSIVNSAIGPIDVQLLIENHGIRSIAVRNDSLHDVSDVSDLVPNDFMIEHLLLLCADQSVRAGWAAVFSEYLDEELRFTGPEDVTEIRVVTPGLPPPKSTWERLAPKDNGQAFKAYCDLMAKSNGVNFFGILLPNLEELRPTENGLVISRLIIMEDVLARLVIPLWADGFYEDHLGETCELYARTLDELFQRLREDVVTQRFLGTQ